MNRHERRKREAEEREQSRRLIIPGGEGWANDDVPEDFDTFFDGLRERALPPNDGDPPLHIWAFNGKRRFLQLAPPTPSDTDGRDMVAKAVRRILREFGATRVAVITEAWMGRPWPKDGPSPTVRPSLDPDRIEILTITVEDVSGRERSGMFKIGRNPDGSAFLHDWQENDSQMGRLVGLLQQEPHGTVQ